MSLWTILARARRLYPASIAVVDGPEHTTYAQLGDRTDNLARLLEAMGLQAQDRIATLLPNSRAALESYFAAAGLGAILVPLNTRLAPEELRFILADSGTRVLIAAPAFAELTRALLARAAAPVTVVSAGEPFPVATGTALAYPAVEPGQGFPARSTPPEAVAHLYYTSGTTGHPKGVMLTHRNVQLHALAAIAELGLSDRDVWAHVAPMFHLADAWAGFAIT